MFCFGELCHIKELLKVAVVQDQVVEVDPRKLVWTESHPKEVLIFPVCDPDIQGKRVVSIMVVVESYSGVAISGNTCPECVLVRLLLLFTSTGCWSSGISQNFQWLTMEQKIFVSSSNWFLIHYLLERLRWRIWNWSSKTWTLWNFEIKYWKRHQCNSQSSVNSSNQPSVAIDWIALERVWSLGCKNHCS